MDEDTHQRRWALQMQQPPPPATVFDRIIFLIGAAAAVWMAVLIGIQGLRTPWALIWFVPIWAITAYLVLPRLHRLLSDLYVPDYFFGRTRTGDGLLGDPVNLGVDGTASQLDHLMTEATWHRADEITAVSTWRIIVSTLTRRSYRTAPVSPLMLFGRRHDVAYQQEVAGNPKQRHHVRFWHCPPGWLLPGGARTDWLGAATYDTDVGISFFTLQVTHRIDQNTDVERDHVVTTLREADDVVELRVLHDFTTGYHSRNGGGDRFVTDGDLPIVDVSEVDVSQYAPPSLESSRRTIERAPLTVVAAASLVVITALLSLASLLTSGDIDQWFSTGDSLDVMLILALLAVEVLMDAAQLLMAWFLLRRGLRSRAILMVLVTLSILFTAIDYIDGATVLGLNAALLTASVQCITLLCLSSESAGTWARRERKSASRALAQSARA